MLSFTTWLVNEFFSSSHFDAIKTFKYWFPQNRWFYKQRNFFKMMLEFRKDWKDLAFAGKYNSLKNGFCSNCQQKCYIQMLHYWCRQHNFLLKCCKTWKSLVFVGKYNSPNDRSLKHLSTKLTFNCSINDVGTTIFF